MVRPQGISVLIAFVAGLLTFASPCVFALVPWYLSHIIGMTIFDIRHEDRGYVRRLTSIHSLFFILGFSVIFVGLGASATLIGEWLVRYRDIIRKIGGVLIIIFGLHLMGAFRLKVLETKRSFQLKKGKPIGFIGSILAGCIFAFAWTPCVGPILSTILLYAGTSNTVAQGVLLLTAYSLGLGIPFFLTALAINSVLSYFDKLKRYLGLVSILSGIFLIIVGVLLLTNYLQVLSGYLIRWTGTKGI